MVTNKRRLHFIEFETLRETLKLLLDHVHTFFIHLHRFNYNESIELTVV